MGPGHELLKNWDERIGGGRLHPRMEMTGEGLLLGNEGEKALAHIHLAHANLLECDEDRASRLFVADELLEPGVTPAALMKAQGFDPVLLKFNPDQPRVPSGSGRESGRWTSDVTGSVDAAVIPVSFRTRQRIKALRDFYRMVSQPVERFKARDSSGKSAARQ